MINKPEFYEKLKTLLNSGISVKKALEILSSRESGGMKRVLLEINRKIDYGETLAFSLQSQPGIFSPFETSLIASGEITGNLEKNLSFLIDHLKRVQNWRRRLLTGLIYPFILFHAAILLPPLQILVMEGFSDYIRAVYRPFLIIYAVFIILFLLKKIVLKSPGASIILEKILWKIPVAGKLKKNLALSRFLNIFGMALKAGLNGDRAIKIASQSASSPLIESSIPEDLLFLLKHGGITGVLQKSGLLSSVQINMIHTGEVSGTVDESLIYTADDMEKQARTLMERLIIVLPVIIYLGVALYVACLIISFYGELYSGLSGF